MSSVVFLRQEIAEIGRDQVGRVKCAAKASPRSRARICLHHDVDDGVQQMVIAFYRDAYVRPHRHLGKSESYHLIEGELELVFFDDAGEPSRRVRMSPLGDGGTFLYRLSNSLWHTFLPLSEFVVIHEISEGPFRDEGSEFAPWGPEESDAEGIQAFLAKIAS